MVPNESIFTDDNVKESYDYPTYISPCSLWYAPSQEDSETLAFKDKSHKDIMDPISDVTKTEVTKQLEFYFSDYNLINDSFLTDLMSKDDGWITFDALMTFNRLKRLVSDNKDLLKEVLKFIESDLIEVKIVEEKVRRRPDKPLFPITEEMRKCLNERTVHLKGFPKETTYEELMNWCLKYGTIETLQMRQKSFKNKENGFKGCIFVTFANKTLANLLINEFTTLYGDKELFKENKIQYYDRKRRIAEQRAKSKLEAKVENMSLENEEKEDSILKLTNVPKDMMQSKIQEFFDQLFIDEPKVKFVLKIFTKNMAFVRFDGKDTAEEVMNKIKPINEKEDENEIQILIEGKEVFVKMVTEEEEKDLNKRAKTAKKTYTNSKKLKKNANKYIEKRVSKLKENPVLEELAVLHIYNTPSTAVDKNNFRVLSQMKVKEFFKNSPKIVDIDEDFNIRFEQRFAARNLLTMLKIDHPEYRDKQDDGILVINGFQYTANVVTGEEEKKFWLSSIDRIERQRLTSKVWKRMKKTTALKLSQYGWEEEIPPRIHRRGKPSRRKTRTKPSHC